MNTKQMPVAVAVVALLLAVGSAQASPIKPGLPTYSWLEDDGAGSTITAQYGGNNGTKTSAASWSTTTPFSYSGNHSILAGNTGAFTAPGGTLGTTGTMSMWLDRTVSSTQTYIVFDDSGTTGNRSYLTARDDTSSENSINGSSPNTMAATTGLFTQNTWYLLTVTWTPTVLTYYVDGVVKGTGTGPGVNTSSGGTWYVGMLNNPGLPLPWLGLMDEVAVWNTALSTDNIAWLQSNSLSTIAIPEPSSLSLLGLLGGAFLLRRKLCRQRR